MKWIKILVQAFLFTSLSSYCFAAGFMKIEGIKGESKDSEHKDWIDILSVSGLAPEGKSREKGSGLATGKRQHKPLTITKEIDKSSPMLARSNGGSSIPDTIVISQNGIAYELTGVSVKSVRRVGKNEELVVTYTGVKQSSARDYNSSRSNRTSRSADPANHNVTRSNKRAQQAAPANHNTTRSNRTSP